MTRLLRKPVKNSIYGASIIKGGKNFTDLIVLKAGSGCCLISPLFYLFHFRKESVKSGVVIPGFRPGPIKLFGHDLNKALFSPAVIILKQLSDAVLVMNNMLGTAFETGHENPSRKILVSNAEQTGQGRPVNAHIFYPHLITRKLLQRLQ